MGKRMGGGWWGREGDTYRAERQSSARGRLCLPRMGLFPLFAMAKPGLLHPFLYHNDTFEFIPVEGVCRGIRAETTIFHLL